LSVVKLLLFATAILAALVLMGWIFLAPEQPLPAGAGVISIVTLDGPRTAIILPPGEGPHPTVIVLHGGSGTAEEVAQDTGFAEAATRNGFTAVFAQGLRRQWQDGRVGRSGPPDDVAFLAALVDRLIATRIALPGHVYISGISNGGSMSFAMACKAGRLFCGVGAVVATMPGGLDRCDPPPTALVMINGSADPLEPYEGGEVGWISGGGSLWSVAQTTDFFVRVNGCAVSTERALPQHDPKSPTRVTEIRWDGCRSGKPVALYRIDGGGHQIPGAPVLPTFLFGQSTKDISAAEVILSAFAREEAGQGPVGASP
jgi:polyhydroxybutyrate depolymerase